MQRMTTRCDTGLLRQRLLPTLVVVSATIGWNYLAVGRFSIVASLFFFAFVAVSILVGGVFVGRVLGCSPRFASYSIRLVIGFLALNIALYAAALILPLPISASVLIIMAGGLLLWWSLRGDLALADQFKAPRSELWFLLFCVVAATFWSQDSFRLLLDGPSESILRGWQDTFFHLRQISAFAAAQGSQSMSDIQMAGAPTHPYHFASYMLPATLLSITSQTSVQVYGGTYLPFGLLLLALAAFSLLASVFGKRAAMAGTAALLCAPDASQQGFGNSFLSYHWLQNIAPAGLYCISILAVAWLIMFEACRGRRLLLVGVAYVIGACALVFKAQFFVATAYLLLVFPAFFMVGISTSVRRLHFYGMTAIFVLTVYASQFASSIPILRLDGTGISGYGFSLLSAQREGIFTGAVTYVFEVATGGTFVLATAAVLLFGTFGGWVIVYPLLFNRVRTRFSLMAALLPVLITLNYLVMSQGLALDSRAIGRPEELLHRPFVWAYFIVVTWSAAAVYGMFWPEELLPNASSTSWPVRNTQQDRLAPALVALVATLALAVPALLGRGIHSLALWHPDVRGVAIPSCVVKAANYIRSNSEVSDVVLASDNDPHFVVTALAERQVFVADAGGVRAPEGIYRRLGQVNNRLNRMTEPDEVAAFFNRNAIAWYLRGADATLAWSEATERFVVYRCGSVRVYHFPSG
jgi:hypothetical protein